MRLNWLLKSVVVAGLFVQAAALRAEDGHEGWVVSFDKAKEQATQEKKDIFIEFTGSDWCPPCIALREKVLSQDAFKTEAPKSFVLLLLDSPNDKSKQSEEEQKHVAEMSAKFGVEGVPSIYLADEKGTPYAVMVGFDGSEPDAYLKKLESLREVRATRDAAMEKAAKAEGVEKAKLLDEALSGVDSKLYGLGYMESVEEIVKIDADGAAGLKDKYVSIMKAAEFKKIQGEIIGLARAKKFKEAIDKLDESIKSQELTGVELQQALFLKTQLLFGTDKKAAKAALEAAIDAAPETQEATRFKAILNQAFADVKDE